MRQSKVRNEVRREGVSGEDIRLRKWSEDNEPSK